MLPGFGSTCCDPFDEGTNRFLTRTALRGGGECGMVNAVRGIIEGRSADDIRGAYGALRCGGPNAECGVMNAETTRLAGRSVNEIRRVPATRGCEAVKG